MTDPVLVAQDGPVRTLTLNRPSRRNALDLDDRRVLLAALLDAEGDHSCRAVVLTGAQGVFCAGGDIRSMSRDRDVARARLAVVNDIARALVRSPKPVVAAVESGAFGLGLSLAAASDYVVAAADARFVASFAKLGLTADTGLFWSLSQRIGPGRAKELILLAGELTAERAHRMGLVSEVVPGTEVLERAMERAGQLAAASPAMVAGTKKIFAQERQDLESVLAAEAEIQVELLAGDDFAEGRAAFLERRAPTFTG
ncbi:enoyl-CoA hydratase/isomerase family protein [Streptomyces botrytidirepellens]|uniref:Enoyl-CoA hydratase/isomerase family protein n=1 Tax=Streptomyces botrytidirepellens TaxID=2486417 RepID=A0A3M8SHC4_9ACTN|nr:enoyl-CoA hydratase/isomerase family protein [Streptomyces botrytidirepellens]RNF78230.1 enoyl-CoA hydratase/isomerase family protein [Streptomyces botrytidirepellens]